MAREPWRQTSGSGEEWTGARGDEGVGSRDGGTGPARLPGDAADGEADRGWLWPAAIVVGLLLVVAVNVGFAVVAVRGADEIVESYVTEER
jgi:hypothetical protein